MRNQVRQLRDCLDWLKDAVEFGLLVLFIYGPLIVFVRFWHALSSE